VNEYSDEVEAGAGWLSEWLRLVVGAEWPGAVVSYEGEAAGGSRAWRISAGAAEYWFAVTEPTLLEPMLRDVPILLERLDLRKAMRMAEPDGLLISTGGRIFAWDQERDRGTRLLELDT
jgi:hypothetical protein